MRLARGQSPSRAVLTVASRLLSFATSKPEIISTKKFAISKPEL